MTDQDQTHPPMARRNGTPSPDEMLSWAQAQGITPEQLRYAQSAVGSDRGRIKKFVALNAARWRQQGMPKPEHE